MLLNEGGHGIYLCLLLDVDRMLIYGLKAGCIVEELKANFPSLPTSVAQIYNRKALF